MFEGLFQPMHLIIIMVIALVIFGPGKLSEIGGSMGKAIRDFKKSMKEPEEGPDIKHIERKEQFCHSLL